MLELFGIAKNLSLSPRVDEIKFGIAKIQASSSLFVHSTPLGNLRFAVCSQPTVPWGRLVKGGEILENQQEITTLTVIWARQLVSPQPKLGPS